MSKNDKTLSEKMAELRQYVAWFESDEFEIERSIEKCREAEALAEEIQQDLNEFRNEITIMQKKFDQ